MSWLQIPDDHPAPGRGSVRPDRHDRGTRVPLAVGNPRRPTSRARFDAVVSDLAAAVEARHGARLPWIEYAVEDTPLLPENWEQPSVPLSSLIRGDAHQPTRLVFFRRPIEHRCDSRAELRELVRHVMVEQLADLLSIPPAKVLGRRSTHLRAV